MNPANRRILLVDDMPSIHDDFRKIFAPQSARPELNEAEDAMFGEAASKPCGNFELDCAYQGQEGAAKVEASLQAGLPYAMAFVDMRMPPGWNGVETIERLWQIDPRLQVVICTAHADQPWEEILERLDVRDRLLIVKKPFDMIEVSQLARSLTAKWALARQAESQVQGLEQAVRELKATESALRQSNEELEVFAHSLSHDLRSPLGIVRSFSGLLASELEGDISDKARHYLARIQASAALGERLIEGLLVLDRVSRAPLSIEPLDLSAMARRVLDELRRADPQRDVAIAVQEGLSAQGDRRLVQIAMRELLDNAWKFTSRREEALIEVGSQAGDNGEPVYFVRDNGCGFDMAYADKLFRPFQRLHPVHEYPGTGVGLITASRALDRYGGRCWADTRPGEGATFHFTLPSAPSPQLARRNRDSAPEADS
ncbi:MAG: ATP-binding protein [Pseudomonadota bacterium]